MNRICIVPGGMGIGGPASFRRKLTAGLESRNIAVTFDLDDTPYDAVLVINGTRQLAKLLRCKRKGIRIVQRLGLPNNPRYHLTFGFKWYLNAIKPNWVMTFIR